MRTGRLPCLLAAWCLSACAPGSVHDTQGCAAAAASAHCRCPPPLQRMRINAVLPLRGGMGVEEDVDTGESEWVLEQDWKGVNNWGRTDEWGNALPSHDAGSSEPESSSFLLGPTPLAVRTDPSTGVGGVGCGPDQEQREREADRERERQMQEEFEELFLPVCERKAREREREAVRARERDAEQQRQRRRALTLGIDSRGGERDVHHDQVGAEPSDQGLTEDSSEETGQGTFKSDSTDEAIFWGFKHHDPCDVFMRRPMAENADAYMR